MFEHTDLFYARVTEKKLVELWGPRLKKCPSNWRMLADRGFANTAHYYPKQNPQLTPTFLEGRDRFTAGEVKSDYEICRLRYTCEVAFLKEKPAFALFRMCAAGAPSETLMQLRF